LVVILVHVVDPYGYFVVYVFVKSVVYLYGSESLKYQGMGCICTVEPIDL